MESREILLKLGYRVRSCLNFTVKSFKNVKTIDFSMISGSFERIFHFSFLIYLDKSSNKKQKIHLKVPPKSEEIKFKRLLRKKGKLGKNVLPFWTVFQGDITRDPCRVREIILWCEGFDDHYFFWRNSILTKIQLFSNCFSIIICYHIPIHYTEECI